MLNEHRKQLSKGGGGEQKGILFPVLSPELQEPPDPHIIVLLAKDIDHESK